MIKLHIYMIRRPIREVVGNLLSWKPRKNERTINMLIGVKSNIFLNSSDNLPESKSKGGKVPGQ